MARLPVRRRSCRAHSSIRSTLTGAGDTLYFSAYGYPSGYQLWKTDGTAAGTVRLTDLHPGTTQGGVPRILAVLGDTVYVSADDGITGEELWKSDGTEAGTKMVADIYPGAYG